MVDILMWVGAQHYPTIQSYVDEANRLGVCKRVSRAPQGVKRLFLAHDEGFEGEGVIFGYVEVEGLEIVVEDGVIPPKGYTAAPMSQVQQEAARGCGFRQDAGATYLVARTGPLVLIEPGVDFEAISPSVDKTRQRFRSWKRVDGDAILACEVRLERPTARFAKVEARIGRWSDEERASLLLNIASRPVEMSQQEAARRWSLENGRSLGGTIYQLAKIAKGIVKENEDD